MTMTQIGGFLFLANRLSIVPLQMELYLLPCQLMNTNDDMGTKNIL
jgi:hypothetical protein